MKTEPFRGVAGPEFDGHVRPVLAGLPAMILAAACLLGSGAPASAQLAESAPDELDDVEPAELPGAQIPLDLPFVDSSGQEVNLRDCFDGTRPVILTMNYSDCPMLCSLQLTGLFEALGKMEWDIGQNCQIVTISIDPAETSQRAQETKDKYLAAYDRPGVAEGWHFLTGTKENIDKVASSVGFRYKYLHDKKQYAHAAVFMVATPDGRVSRYLYGIQFDPETVRMSLLEAGEGQIGSAADRVLLYCFQYDPRSGSYVPAAMNIMRAGGVLLMLLLGGLIGGLILVRRIRGRRAAGEQPGDTAANLNSTE